MPTTLSRSGPAPADLPRRELAGFVVAPVASVVLWLALSLARLVAIDGLSAAGRDLPSLLLGGATLGLAVAVAATILLAGPLYALLVVLDRVSPASVLLGGAAVGWLVAVGLGTLGGVESLLPWWVGVCVGVGTAALWWRIGGVRPTGRA